MTQTQSKVVTGEVRFSYAHLYSPDSGVEGGEPKYSLTLLIPKTDQQTLGAISNVLRSLQAQAAAKYGGRLPVKFVSNPVRDGDVEKPEQEEYKGMYFLSAKSSRKPGIVLQTPNGLVESTSEDDVYSGCYGRVSVNFFIYDKAGSRGIAAGLNNVMKTRDGEYLGGRASAKSDFAEFDKQPSGADDFMQASQGAAFQTTYPQQADQPADNLPF